MKKLALGLLLTAGISGNAWASERKADVKIIKNKCNKLYHLYNGYNL
ncbi:hypothetical protein [Amniculibacterium sp. G2-70]|nr:hypothetical protein [Amniculibacterium sp. G2-70]